VLHLNTNSGKMSKSTGEFLTVSLLEEKGYNPLAYRFFCLQSHYRKSLVFSYENLDNAQGAFNKLLAKIAALKADEADEIDENTVKELTEKFKNALDNDINTSLGITVLYDVLKAKTNDKTKIKLLDDFDKVLSLSLLDEAKKLNDNKKEENSAVAVDDDFSKYVEEQLSLRAEAKKNKNWAEADRIRDELTAKGVKILDTPEGSKWSL
jgi:cysteinyl-tRNA synthetase